MKRPPAVLTLAAAVLLAGALLAACNVLDPVYGEGGSVEDLLEDARHARANADFGRAVVLLERALVQAPADRRVRTALAGALLQREGLGLIDVVDVSSHVLEALGRDDGARASARGTAADACTFAAEEPATPFDPLGLDGYEAIAEASPVLGYVLDLLRGRDEHGGPGSAVIPDLLEAVDLCAAVTPEGLSYDREALLAELRAGFSGTAAEVDRRVNAALDIYTTAAVLDAYRAIFEEQVPVRWYIYGEGQDRLGYCAPAADFDAIEQKAEEQIPRLGRAVLALDLRLANGSGSDDLEAILDDVVELYHQFRDELTSLCSAG